MLPGAGWAAGAGAGAAGLAAGFAAGFAAGGGDWAKAAAPPSANTPAVSVAKSDPRNMRALR